MSDSNFVSSTSAAGECAVLSIMIPSMCRQPRDYILDFLVGHGSIRNVVPPAWNVLVGAAGDHRGAQRLVAGQREKRFVNDRSGQLAAASIDAMTARAVRLVRVPTFHGIARSIGSVRRLIDVLRLYGVSPLLLDPVYERLNLLVG